VLLCETLQQPLDARLPRHLIELGAVCEYQAHALYGDVVDLPALGRLVHRVVDGDRRLARPDVLVAHGDVGRAGARAGGLHAHRLATVRIDRVRVDAHEHRAERVDELLLLLGRCGRPRLADGKLGRFGEID